MSDTDYDRIAEIYDLYVTADYDIPFFLSEAAETAGPVLELAAGTGRLSLPLIEAGLALTCVDRSRGMLDVLEKKLAERGLRAELRCADVCALALPPRFALAIFPFQAFMEIVGEARQRAALAAVSDCLAPGARFICTLHNPAVRRAQADGAWRVVGRFPAPDGSLVVSGIEHGGWPVVQRLQCFEFLGPDGKPRHKQTLPMEFELIEEDAFAAMARDAGFRIVALYGDYDRSAFDPARSPVMIWVLRKEAPESSA